MPRSLWFKVLVVVVALWAPLSQADTGWQPIQETIRKSEKDPRHYQAIRLQNGMVVLLVSDPQAVKSLSALNDKQGAEACITAIRELARKVGIPAGLRDLNVKEEDIPLLASNALKDACGLTNPIQATHEEIMAIFRAAM